MEGKGEGWGWGGGGGGGGGENYTRCAGNDRKYKPGEIRRLEIYRFGVGVQIRARDCVPPLSLPLFYPARPSFFLSVAPARRDAASFLLRPERRGVKCSMPPNIRSHAFPGYPFIPSNKGINSRLGEGNGDAARLYVVERRPLKTTVLLVLSRVVSSLRIIECIENFKRERYIYI